MTTNVKVLTRRGTLSALTSENPILGEGEQCWVRDASFPAGGKLKIGDGVTAFNSLPYTNDIDAAMALANAIEIQFSRLTGSSSGLTTGSVSDIKEIPKNGTIKKVELTATDVGTDLSTITQLTSDTTRAWMSVGASTDGTIRYAAVNGGYLYKSVNGGAFTAVGTNIAVQNFVGRLLVSPDGSEVISCVNNTTNSFYFYKNSTGNATITTTPYNLYTLSLHYGTGFSVVYAISPSIANKPVKITRSGDTFTVSTMTAFPVTTGGTLLGIDCAPANPNIVYVAQSNVLGGFYKSIDGGTSFTQKVDFPATGSATQTRQVGLICNTDGSRIIVAGLSNNYNGSVSTPLLVSSDSGVTFTQTTGGTVQNNTWGLYATYDFSMILIVRADSTNSIYLIGVSTDYLATIASTINYASGTLNELSIRPDKKEILFVKANNYIYKSGYTGQLEFDIRKNGSGAGSTIFPGAKPKIDTATLAKDSRGFYTVDVDLSATPVNVQDNDLLYLVPTIGNLPTGASALVSVTI